MQLQVRAVRGCMCSCTGERSRKGCWHSCPLLGSLDTALLANKTGSSACHCWNHSYCQTPSANTANYFSMPIPDTASQCPFILIFSLSPSASQIILLLISLQFHIPSVFFYTLMAWVVLPNHNCLLLVYCLHFPCLTSSLPFPSLLHTHQSKI